MPMKRPLVCFRRLVILDECLVHCYADETKFQSKQQEQFYSVHQRTPEMSSSLSFGTCEKSVTLTDYLHRGRTISVPRSTVILTDYVHHGSAISCVEMYSDTDYLLVVVLPATLLQKLREDMKCKTRRMLPRGFRLLRDNPPEHCSISRAQ